jgi:Primosomal protein N'' (replication factor Y) - superfamily II helicase
MQCKVCNNQLSDDLLFCPKCGTPVEKKAAIFCPKCGTKANDGDLFCSKCGYRLGQPESITCVNCGSTIKAGMTFCPKCGRKVGSAADNSTNNSVVDNHVINGTDNIRQNVTSETELYRKGMIGYYAGIGGMRQISGTLVITNKRISYKPLGIYVLDKPFEVGMNEITRAERASVMGIKLCIRVYTISGKNPLFALGVQNSKDIDYVIDLINKNRGR